MTVEERLQEIKALLLVALAEREPVKAFYDIEEFARLVGQSTFHSARMGEARPHPGREEAVRPRRSCPMGRQSR